MATSIHIEIERLILHGLPLDQRQARLVQSAIESELSLQMSSPGIAERFGTGGAVARAAAEPVNWSPASGPSALGTQLGQTISRSIPQ